MKGKTQATTQEKTVRRPRRQSRSTARSRSRLLREIAIDGEIAISPSLRDCDRRGDRDLREFAPSIAISILREIAIDGEIAIFARLRRRSRSWSASRDRDQRRREVADWRSRPTTARDRRTGDRRRGLEIVDWRSRSTTARSRPGDRDRARARSLSLSHIFRKHFEGKIEV